VVDLHHRLQISTASVVATNSSSFWLRAKIHSISWPTSIISSSNKAMRLAISRLLPHKLGEGSLRSQQQLGVNKVQHQKDPQPQSFLPLGSLRLRRLSKILMSSVWSRLLRRVSSQTAAHMLTSSFKSTLKMWIHLQRLMLWKSWLDQRLCSIVPLNRCKQMRGTSASAKLSARPQAPNAKQKVRNRLLLLRNRPSRR